MRKILIAAISLFFINFSYAQPDMPLDQRQKLAQIEKAISAADSLKSMVEEIARVRKEQCMEAFGHSRFCGCLSENLPVALSFQQYISVATHSKSENKYFDLNKENKKIYDNAVLTRDKCVKQL